MGWMVYHTERRELIADILRNLTFERNGHRMHVVAHCLTGNTLWAVCEHQKPELGDQPAESYRFIAVYLIRRYGPGEWGYKDKDEDCGPCEVNCPLAYLDLAPETTHLGEYSRSWRAKVRAYWAGKRKGREFAKTLKPGDIFYYGPYHITFERLDGPNNVIGTSIRGRFRYRVSEIGPIYLEAKPEPVAAFKKEVPAGAIVVPV